MTGNPPPGARLYDARKRLGWTLRDAERESGVPNAHISQIETGAITSPGPAVVARLAKAYGMDAVTTMSLNRGAVEAAASVICDWYCGTGPEECLNRPAHTQLAEGILGTVAPYLYAGEVPFDWH